jgi:hypothetical protein
LGVDRAPVFQPHGEKDEQLDEARTHDEVAGLRAVDSERVERLVLQRLDRVGLGHGDRLVDAVHDHQLDRLRLRDTTLSYNRVFVPSALQSPLTDSNRRPPPYHGGFGASHAYTRDHLRHSSSCKSIRGRTMRRETSRVSFLMFRFVSACRRPYGQQFSWAARSAATSH